MRGRLAILAAVTALLASLAGCGGAEGGPTTVTTAAPPPTTATTAAVPNSDPFVPNLPEPVTDDDNRFPRPSSVGDGEGTAPDVDAALQAQAAAAGCEVRAFDSTGRTHLEPDAAFGYSTDPPTSGDHYRLWADWGVYDQPVPFPVQVHNLEHGGVVVHVGPQVAPDLRQAIGELWASSPPFMLVVPATGDAFPPAGVVVTSWQRWLVCRSFTRGAVEVVRAFRDAYRGTGPEGAAGLNSGVEHDLPGMPAPLVRDPGA